MFPLRDNIRSRSFPFVTLMLVLANLAAFLYKSMLPARELERFMLSFSLIPARVTEGVMEGRPLVVLTLITSAFLHANFWHLFGNMYFLWIFGDNVEDSMGHFRYLVFYLLCGFIAGLVYYLSNARSTTPTVGASGAVAGVLGAYFLLFPFARILTLVPIFFFIEVPALIFLGLWFALQFLYVLSPLGIYGRTMIAYWAHIGGFVAGAVLVWLFRKSGHESREKPAQNAPFL